MDRQTSAYQLQRINENELGMLASFISGAAIALLILVVIQAFVH